MLGTMNGKSPRQMRRTLRLLAATLLLACALLPVSASRAQQAGDDAAFIAPNTSRPETDTNVVAKPAPYDIAGIVAQAFKTKKPLQLVNPLAPAKYGDGHDAVSWDPDKPEKPKGIILFGIQW